MNHVNKVTDNTEVFKMTKMTSAYANKLIKKLEEDKDYLRNKENESCVYTAGEGEEPLIPDYDFAKVAKEIDEIDCKICTIKHAINLANVTSKIDIDGEEFTVDAILVRMAQLNKRKITLDSMRRRQPKTRLNSSYASIKKPVVEYTYTNYDIELAKAEYEQIDNLISKMQLQLDKYNQTVEFEVEI